MYQAVKKAAVLYHCLEDDLSKKVFWARLKYAITPSLSSRLELLRLNRYVTQDQIKAAEAMKSYLEQAIQQGKKIVIYGTGLSGTNIATDIQGEGLDFSCFCGRRAAEFTNGLMGKPVISPEYLFEHMDEYYIIIGASASYEEILKNLRRHDVPAEQICPSAATVIDSTRQYIDCVEYYPEGTAFLDGGCYDGFDSLQFAQLSQGKYSKIFAFEPDEKNIARCRDCKENHLIRDMVLVQAGLSDTSGEVCFSQNGSASSHILEKPSCGTQQETVHKISTVTIDETLKDETVGWIKMDIEGAEYGALHGGEKTIIRDRPLLTICVYHKQGDMLAIMDYLHQIVPDYHFRLRCDGDTVLYAYIDAAQRKGEIL